MAIDFDGVPQLDRDAVLAAYHQGEACPHCHRRGRLWQHHDYCVLWGVPIAQLARPGDDITVDARGNTIVKHGTGRIG